MESKFLGSRYEIKKLLSRGGFGTTYLAEDTQYPNNPLCVVKKLNSRIDNVNTEFLTIARRLFKKEAQTLAKLGKHDQIPRLLAFFEQEQEFYLVQEYVEGETLSHELIANQPWSQEKVTEFLKDLLSIVDFIHSNGVIHRDIKPDNLIRRKIDNKLVLVDFGTVKEVIQAQTEAISITVSVGTRGYMPTEQARGKPRYSSDIYAVGMIAIQALTGIHPLQLQEDSHGELLWLDRISYQPQLAEILTKMIRYHFKERYQSAAEILKLINHSLSENSNYSNNNKPTNQSKSLGTKLINRNNQKLQLPLKSLEISLTGLILVGITIVGIKYFPINSTAQEIKLAQQAAQSGNYRAAIELTQGLSNTPGLQQKIEFWSEQLLKEAQAKYTTKGELNTASLIIEDIIPENSSAKKSALKLLAGWRREYEYNQSILNIAQEELQQERWQNAKNEASKITGKTFFWREQANKIIQAADLGIQTQPGVVDLCSKAPDLCN